jgi:predicted RNA-binding Zn-ribbon protein involved in translation (DUF1610 family)
MSLWSDRIPVIEVKKRLNQFVFTCPECGEEHSHLAAHTEEYRLSKCKAIGAFPDGYYAFCLPDPNENLAALKTRLLMTPASAPEREMVRTLAYEINEIEMEFWEELSDLGDDPIPDPGCRPDSADVFAFCFDRSAVRDFTKLLGYLHRIREYVERLEAKYSGVEDEI